MKKCLLVICITFSLLFSLISCDNDVNVQEGDNHMQAGLFGINLNINSNSGDLVISLTDKDYNQLVSDYLKNDGAVTIPGWEVKAGLTPCAHDEIKSVDDILNGSCWYTASAKKDNASEMDPSTKRYLDSETIYGTYIGKFEFLCSLSETAPEGDYSFTVTNVEFPQNNAFSVFVVGTDDFVEFNSVGNNSRSNSILVNDMTREENLITIFIYVDGNDERVTNQNLEALNDTTGEIKISFDLIKR